MNLDEIKLDREKVKKIRMSVYSLEKNNEKDNFKKKDPEMRQEVVNIIKRIVDQKR